MTESLEILEKISKSPYYKTLSNTDEFRAAALHFKEFKRYCNYTPNPAKNSSWKKFWREEHRRCIQGYHIGRDYIPGYYYHYLNYSPIWRLSVSEDGKTADRIYSFADVWDGDYAYFHYLDEAEKLGEHGLALKDRGKGYSFKKASMCARNFHHIQGSRTLVLAFEKEYLTGGDGILTKAWENIDFINEHTAFSKRIYKDTEMMRVAGYKIKDGSGKWVTKGFRSRIIGVSLKDNPGKSRGKRSKLIVYEEAGKFPGLKRAWEINRPSVESGNVTFGLQVAIGTGGETGPSGEDLEEMFYKPEGYKIHAVPNIWDKNAENTKSAWFSPAYLNRENCYDKDGNSDILKALAEINADRDRDRLSGKAREMVLQRIAEIPIYPREAVLRVEGTYFAYFKDELEQRLNQILSSPSTFREANMVGKLDVDSETGVLHFRPVQDAEVVREWPIKLHRPGFIEVFKPPVYNNMGVVPHNRYCAGLDPLDQDYSTTDSMFSCVIFDRVLEKVVAEYTTRDPDVRTSYEQCRRLLKWYNAKVLYENNKLNLFSYFETKNSTYLLADTPYQLRNSEWRPNTNVSKGVTAMNGKPAGREALKSWLGRNIDTVSDIINAQIIPSEGILKELISYNTESGNYDRVDALAYAVLYHTLEPLFGELTSEQKLKKESRKDWFSRHKQRYGLTNNDNLRKLFDKFKKPDQE